MISSVSSSSQLQQLQAILGRSGTQSTQGIPQGPPPGPPPDGVKFGPMGDLMSAREGLSEEGKAEMDTYMQDIFQQLKDGTFDPATAAENAPDELKAYMEEQGVALEDVFTELQDFHNEMETMRQNSSYTSTGRASQSVQADLSSLLASLGLQQGSLVSA